MDGRMLRVEYVERGPALQDLLHLVERPMPTPGPGEALVAMQAAPINPSDLLTITGQYGLLPALPSVAGNEAVGTVMMVADDVRHIRADDRVVVPPGFGTWTTHLVVPANLLWTVPVDADLLQLAMVRVNPPTATLMLRDFVALQRGDWVIQNAANGSVGECVVQLARHRGIRTVNIVRRDDAVLSLQPLGADVVLVDGPGLAARVAEATGGAPIRLGLDGVGGRATERLASTLAAAGTVVHYGASGGESSRLSPRSLIFRDITLRGFWLVHWFRRTSFEEQQTMYRELTTLIQRGELRVRVQATFPLARVHEAVTLAAQDGRQGKVLLTP